MDRVVREVVRFAPAAPERDGAQEAEIKSFVEETLRYSGRESIIRNEISVEFEPQRGNGEPLQVTFTLLSDLARDVFRETILPSLMRKYEATYEPAEQDEPEPQTPTPIETASETATATTPEMTPEMTPETTIESASETEETHTSDAPDEPPAVPFPSLTELMAEHAALLQRELEMKSPAESEFLTEVKNFIRNGRETGKSLDSANERRVAQSLLNYWITVLYRAGETDAPDAILAPYTRLEMLELDQAKCPYIGLRPFSEADRDVFFGRTELTRSILNRMLEQRLIALVGPSGSGKTSVINAGVLPTLREGKVLTGSDRWHYFHPIAPGAEPLVSLASLFVEHNGDYAENIKREAANFLTDTEHLTHLVRKLYGDKSGVVITLDQFEEVFVLCKDDLRREAFITNLLNLIRPNVGGHRLVLTMRSDRLDYIVRRPDLSGLFKEAELRMLPLLEADLLDIIVKPARNIGVKFQPGVVGQLIREIYGDLVGLPLLQFALMKLWEEKEGDTITWAAMNRLETCRTALLRSAEEFYKSLSVEERRTTRRLVLKMVRLSDTLEVTGDSARRKDFDRPDEPPEQVSAVLAKLVEAQLVRYTPACTVSICPDDPATANVETSPDDQFELAHEALVRYWPELRTWLKSLREAMVTRQRLEAFAANWVILGRGNVGLLDEFQLHEARTWLQSSEAADLGYDPDLLALVQMSTEVNRREKLQRTILRYGFVGATLLALVITIAFAARTKNLFRRSVSRQLAAQASLNAGSQLDQSLLLSLESYRRDKGALEAVSGLLAGLTHSPHLSAYLHTPAGVEKQAVKQLAFSPDSKTLISLGEKGAAVAWDVEQRRPLDRERPTGQGDGASAQTPSPEGDNFILSPSGKKLALTKKDGSFVLWDVRKGGQLWAQPTTEGAFSKFNFTSSKFTFSPDEKRIVWINNISDASDYNKKYNLVAWDVDGNKQLRSIEIKAEIVTLKFSPDNKVLAYATGDGEIVLLDADTFELMGKPLNEAYAAEWAFSPLVFSMDGKRLASMPDSNTFIVWSVESQKEINKLVINSRENDRASALALSPKGDLLVGGYPDGTIVLWAIAEESPLEFHEKHGREVKNIAFSNDGKRVVSVSNDNSKILLWTDGNHVSTELKLGRSSKPETVAFSPDSQTLAAGTDDGTIILWGIGKESMTGKTFDKLEGQITELSFSTDGTKLFTHSESGSIALYDDLNDPSKVRNLSGNVTRSLEVSIFSPDGKILAASYYDSDQNANMGCGIVLWDVAGGNERTIPPSAHTAGKDINKVDILAISPNNRLLAAGWSSGDITLWSLDNLALLHTYTVRPKVSISSLTFNKDGTRLAADNNSGTIMIWNTTNGQPGESLSRGSNRADIPKHIFTPDSRKLISISTDSITFWDLTNARQHVTERNYEVSDIALDADGRTLVSGNRDGSVSLWDIETHQKLGKLFDGNIPIVSIAHHGSSLTAGRLAVGRQDGSIVLIDVGFETWQNLACRFANRNLTFSEWDSKYKLWEDVSWWNWLWRDKKSLYCTVCPNLPPDKDVPNAKPCG
jgi:WD40 repeat protein